MTLIDKAEALLPCPFCGDQPQFWNAREDVLLCPCLAGPEVHGTSRENAVEIWNRRVIPARGVGVKPLAWEPWNLGVSQARSPFGIYHTWSGYWRRPEGGRGIEADDPEAAAQADYEARILAALSPDATEKGGDAHAVNPRHAPHEASPGVTAGADAAQAREAALHPDDMLPEAIRLIRQEASRDHSQDVVTGLKHIALLLEQLISETRT